jgi:LysM repeat protein
VVVKGDTLTSIAARFGVSAADLKSANGIADEHKLQIGQKLRIPDARAGAQTATKNDESWWSRVKGSF